MSSLLSQLKQRKVVQWVVAYLAAAWVVFQVFSEMVVAPFGLPVWTLRAAVVLLGAGAVFAGILAWYHGEQGRQRVSGAELMLAASVFAAAALSLRFIVPARNAGSAVISAASVTRPLTALEGFETHPACSPDGERIAFSWGVAGTGRKIYLITTGAQTPLQLTKGSGDDAYPTWSPDGREIAFIRSDSSPARYRILAVPAVGGEPRLITSTQRSAGLDWSGDGRLLAFADFAGDQPLLRLFTIDLVTGRRTQVSTTEAGRSPHHDTDPVFSWDSRIIAFVRRTVHSGGGGQVFTQRIGQSVARALTAAESFAWDLEWHPDGESLLLSTGDYGARHIQRISSKRAPDRLAVGSGAQHLAVCPRTKRLVYAEYIQDHDIMVAPGPTASANFPPRTLISSTRDEYMHSFAPDGKRLAFVSGRSGNWELWVSSSDGQNVRQLTSLGHAIFPQWSPDGTRILFSAVVNGISDVFSIGAEGGYPKNQTQDSVQDAIPSWTSDGKAFVYQSHSEPTGWQLWRRAIDGGPALKLAASPVLRPTAAGDGYVYFHRPPQGVWRLPLAGGREQHVLEGPLWTEWTVWRDRLVFLEHGRSSAYIKSFNLRTSQVDIVAELPKFVKPQVGPVDDVVTSVSILTLAVSPDGRVVAYSKVQRTGSDLIISDVIR